MKKCLNHYVHRGILAFTGTVVTLKSFTMKRDKISAIIACYKDDKAIPIMYNQLVEVFQKIDVDFEILFVNDGSPDDTEIVLHDLVLRDSRVIAINHSRNFRQRIFCYEK